MLLVKDILQQLYFKTDVRELEFVFIAENVASLSWIDREFGFGTEKIVVDGIPLKGRWVNLANEDSDHYCRKYEYESFSRGKFGLVVITEAAYSLLKPHHLDDLLVSLKYTAAVLGRDPKDLLQVVKIESPISSTDITIYEDMKTLLEVKSFVDAQKNNLMGESYANLARCVDVLLKLRAKAIVDDPN